MYNRTKKVRQATNGRFNSTKRTYRYKYAGKLGLDKVSLAYIKLVGVAFIIYCIVDTYLLGGM